ncbi:hypothetical protein AWB81_03436 [Caballeronia arationis]|nr:hypothetical protein AWB81_03436 [Caballeronia arationis]
MSQAASARRVETAARSGSRGRADGAASRGSLRKIRQTNAHATADSAANPIQTAFAFNDAAAAPMSPVTMIPTPGPV